MPENQVVDTTQEVIPGQTAASPPADGAVPTDATPSSVPYDQDPKWLAAREAQKNQEALLKDNGYESVEDLVADLQAGRELKGQLGDLDITDVLTKAGTMDKYNAYWAEQEDTNTAETLTADDRYAALEKKFNEYVNGQQAEKQAATDKLQAEQVVTDFGKEVNSFIAKEDVVPEEYRGFMAEFSGVGNRFNEIDITDTPAVRAMMSDHVKKVQSFEQAVIKRYRDGKIKIPVITESTPVDTTPKKPPIKNLREAKVRALELMTEARNARESQ